MRVPANALQIISTIGRFENFIAVKQDRDSAPHTVHDASNSRLGSGTRTILYIVNIDWFFLSHRLALALGAQAAGYTVHIACRTTERKAELLDRDFEVHPLQLERGRSGLGSTISSWWEIYRVIRRVKPDVVHLVTVKPVLLGGIAARLARVPRVVAAISGLGYLFIAQGPVAQFRRYLVGVLYRLALQTPRVRVIFQNTDDCALISGLAGLSSRQVYMIRGSGVDLRRFRPTPLPKGPFVVALAARLLIDKGIREFSEAARIVRGRGFSARFLIAGDRDEHNPACMPDAEISNLRAEGIVEFLGKVSDIPALFAHAHVVVLPSYREGMPLALLEAAAAGRAVITTDVPGCRSAIEADTGILVPVRDGPALAEAIITLILDPARCEQMGRQGRLLAERAFEISDVVATHLGIYGERNEITNPKQPPSLA